MTEKQPEALIIADVLETFYRHIVEVRSAIAELRRLAELEQRNRDLYEDVQRFKTHALNEKAARLELERQLEEARNQVLEEAAKVCDVTPPQPFRPSIEAAYAIRALKGAKE